MYREFNQEKPVCPKFELAPVSVSLIRNLATDIPISVNTPATFRLVLEYRWDR